MSHRCAHVGKDHRPVYGLGADVNDLYFFDCWSFLLAFSPTRRTNYFFWFFFDWYCLWDRLFSLLYRMFLLRRRLGWGGGVRRGADGSNCSLCSWARFDWFAGFVVGGFDSGDNPLGCGCESMEEGSGGRFRPSAVDWLKDTSMRPIK
ncbi:hypothetical protein [Methylacidiphilum kamchatkense]|uniref:hypothetical protein n=1 Tax=Methylacidiphilum kamchatkense TaxID=431057 RepID=UPI00155A782E|nr:hypothetical protein [Methylacidiphilum kamchatkense]